MKKLFLTNFLFTLCKMACIAFFASQILGQHDYPTGDKDFTPDQVDTVKENLYEGLDIDGAAQVKESADISRINNWKLKIRNQGMRNICQSYAVAYALDILDRKNYHSPAYIWDSLFYQHLQNPNDTHFSEYKSCVITPDACAACGTGLNVWEAMKQASLGVPFENKYKVTNCGSRQPVFIDSFAAKKYRAVPIYYNARICRFCRSIETDPVNIDEAIREAKKKISNINPVLISIYAPPLKKYKSGVLDYEGDIQIEDWHAMTVVGYDDNKIYGNNGERGAFKIANTWANADESWWGEDGYLWISYESFKKLVRFIGFMNVDENQKIYDWEPVISPDGSSGQEIKPNSRIGIFQLELLEAAKNNTFVCLDANTSYPKDSKFQVILYKCHDETKQLNNQKWDVIFKEEQDGENYYVLRSLSDENKDKVLAIKEGKLVLEDESENFDKNQLWLIRKSPETGHRAIAWAGRDGEFILQGDETRLKEYTDETAVEASIILETFNNLPRQTWRFRCPEANNPKCVNPPRR